MRLTRKLFEDIEETMADFAWTVCITDRNKKEQIESLFRVDPFYKDYQEDIQEFWQPCFNFDDEKESKIADNLFAHYLFVFIRKSSLVWTLLEQRDYRVYRFFTSFLKKGRSLLFLKEDEVQKLKEICNNKSFLQEIDSLLDLSVGDIETIKKGLFKEFDIEVTKVKKHNKIEGLINLFNTRTVIEVNTSDLVGF